MLHAVDELMHVATAGSPAFLAHSREKYESDQSEHGVGDPHRNERRNQSAAGERLARDEADVVEPEDHQAHSDCKTDAAPRKPKRNGCTEKHEDEARGSKRELLLDLDVVAVEAPQRLHHAQARALHLP